MHGRYDTPITFSTDYGEQVDVPAVIDYTANLEPADPSVGEFYDAWEVTAEIVSVNLSGLTLDRSQLVAATSEAEMQREEQRISEMLQADFTNGDMCQMAAE